MLGHTTQHSETIASSRLLLEVRLYLQAKTHDTLGIRSKSQHSGSNPNFRLLLEEATVLASQDSQHAWDQKQITAFWNQHKLHTTAGSAALLASQDS